MINKDYLRILSRIDDPMFKSHKDNDFIPAMCCTYKEEEWAHYPNFGIGGIAESLNNAPIGEKVDIFFKTPESKEEFRIALGKRDNEYYKVVRPKHETSESGFYYYVSPTEADSLIRIEISDKNNLNATAVRVDIAELMAEFEDSEIKLNEFMGDEPKLCRFPEYLDRYNDLVDAGAFK